MTRFASGAIAFAVAAILVPAQDSRPSPALRGFDPVDLASGKESPGAAQWTASRGGLRYVFASEANLRAFEAEPERFEIQMGGACARMGPRSGRGSPDRFAVHGGRIYVFASDQCRAGFLKAPEKFLDPDEAAPAGDAAARAAGGALVEKAVASLGGASRLDAVRTCDAIRSWKTKTADGEREDRVRLRISGDRYRLDEHWGTWSFTTVVKGDAGFTVGNDDKVEDLHASAVRDFHREMLRNPLLLLRARGRPGFVAVADASSGDKTLAWVTVSFMGTTTRLGLDPSTGEIRESRHRGRTPALWFGSIVRRYSDYRDSGGVRMPHRVEVESDGKPEETRVFESIQVDGDVPDAVFERPGSR